MKVLLTILLCLAPLHAQTTAQGTAEASPAAAYEQSEDGFVKKTASAIRYKLTRQRSTTIGFTSRLLRQATGTARIERRDRLFRIDATFEGLEPATKFGVEYLTYVMWAVTPQGSPEKIGEVLVNQGRARLTETTQLAVFGLVVTAEPYFAVSQPSDRVVLENVLLEKTRGTKEAAGYMLLKSGRYKPLINPLILDIDPKVPLVLYQARNAVEIAKSSGAEDWAPVTFHKARSALQRAEDLLRQTANNPKGEVRREIEAASKEAVQTAEDARAIAVMNQETDRQKRELATLRVGAEDSHKARLRAEKQLKDETERLSAEKAAAVREAAREKELAVRQKEELELALAEQKKSYLSVIGDAIDERRKAEQNLYAKEQQIQELTTAGMTEPGRWLLTQFRETSPGLTVKLNEENDIVVQMWDVFASGSMNLQPRAKEKLAWISGIAAAYREQLKFLVEGHTDSVGGEETNRELSEDRAGSVRKYLINLGVPQANVSRRGLGMSTPIAPNDTEAGRRQNRRVELILSGELLGDMTEETEGDSSQEPSPEEPPSEESPPEGP